MCDATTKITVRSQTNHGEHHQVIDILTAGIGSLLAILLASTAYAVTEYIKQLRKAQKEYEKAKDSVEDIVLSFNRELRREADKIENISYRVDVASSKAEVGTKKAELVEKRVEPIENGINEMTNQVTNIKSMIDTISSNNEKTLGIISSLDLKTKLDDLKTSKERIVEINTKIQNVELSHEEVKTKIAELEEKIQKLLAVPEGGIEEVTSTSVLPVMPLRRDKAMASLTETEISVLEFLAAEGPKTAPEIKEKVHLSREHTARLMKKLYEEGYLERETGKLPFKYSVKKEMENLLKKQVTPSV
jgi:hypothetical protein